MHVTLLLGKRWGFAKKNQNLLSEDRLCGIRSIGRRLLWREKNSFSSVHASQRETLIETGNGFISVLVTMSKLRLFLGFFWKLDSVLVRAYSFKNIKLRLYNSILAWALLQTCPTIHFSTKMNLSSRSNTIGPKFPQAFYCTYTNRFANINSTTQMSTNLLKHRGKQPPVSGHALKQSQVFEVGPTSNWRLFRTNMQIPVLYKCSGRCIR